MTYYWTHLKPLEVVMIMLDEKKVNYQLKELTRTAIEHNGKLKDMEIKLQERDAQISHLATKVSHLEQRLVLIKNQGELKHENHI